MSLCSVGPQVEMFLRSWQRLWGKLSVVTGRRVLETHRDYHANNEIHLPSIRSVPGTALSHLCGQ